ncbi:uncharacterized protein LOC134228157 [Armigeres subalbatus]|uniref:uncharacterized protein LOC134228157 n=1 Tax=Armigeres subalbatus TaxID=124917 RepID=UPI002ED6AD64
MYQPTNLYNVRVEVDIVDLFEFAQGSRRNWLEGNEVFKNNHVLIAGVSKVVDDTFHIFCSCLRGSNPAEPPREIYMVASQYLQDWEMRCTCTAGNYRCKHLFTCLLYIHQIKDLEMLSSTDIRQQWGKVAKIQAANLYDPAPLSSLCNQRKKTISDVMSDDLATSILKLFITELPDSALAKSLAGRSILDQSKDGPSPSSNQPCTSLQYTNQPKLPELNLHQRSTVTHQNDFDEVQQAQSFLRPFITIPQVTSKWKYYYGPLRSDKMYRFYGSRVCVSPQKSLMISAETHCQSNNIWRRERSIRITASGSYDLYTYYVNDYGNRDWSKKLSSIIHPMEKRLPSLMYGKEKESIALRCYTMKNPGKTIIRMGFVVPPSAPFMVALQMRLL